MNDITSLLALVAALEKRIAELEAGSTRTHLGAPEQYTVNRGDAPKYEWLPVHGKSDD